MGSDHVADQSAQAAIAFNDGAWATVYRLLADGTEGDLSTADLDRLAVAAYLLGRDEDAVGAWERGYRRHLDADDRPEAARCAFWAALCSMLQGQMAHAGGWLNRAGATIDGLDCPAAGYILMPQLLRALDAGEPATSRDLAQQAGEIADRFGDRDLKAFATLGHGQALLAMGEETAGLAMFDDVMLSVTSGDVGPITSGIVYCAVILECMQIFDLPRAAEWTHALDDWCSAQPDLVPYRGQCLVHQSQVQQAAGDWSRAVLTVSSACDHLSDPPHPALGLAYYQEAELCRLRGDFDAAADAYGRASRAGHQPMPGLALLDRARGAVEDAAARIRRALSETTQPFQRPGLLAAAVEIFITAGDVDAARQASSELDEIAAHSPSDMLTGIADHWAGAVLLASGETSDALVRLRSAAAIWQRLNLQYEAARTAVLIGGACLALEDRKSAELEFDNARETFTTLGAASDLADLEVLTGDGATGLEVLSKRELEVLDHVADGKTNSEIAQALSISRHTVGRHLENIFAKLGVNSRAALTAYAYEHDLR